MVDPVHQVVGEKVVLAGGQGAFFVRMQSGKWAMTWWIPLSARESLAQPIQASAGLDLAHGRRHRLSLRLVGPSEPDQREVPGHISVSANQVLGPSEECGLKHQVIGGVAAHPELTGRRHNVRPGLNHQQVKAGLGIGERPGALQAGPGEDPGGFIQQGR